MTPREIIISEYQTTVALANINSELKRALKTYERIPLFLDNLCKQLAGPKHNFNEFQIRQATHSMTLLFIQMVEKKAKERLMSDVEKQRIKTEAYQKQKLEEKIEKYAKGDRIIIEDNPLEE